CVLERVVEDSLGLGAAVRGRGGSYRRNDGMRRRAQEVRGGVSGRDRERDDVSIGGSFVVVDPEDREPRGVRLLSERNRFDEVSTLHPPRFAAEPAARAEKLRHHLLERGPSRRAVLTEEIRP